MKTLRPALWFNSFVTAWKSWFSRSRRPRRRVRPGWCFSPELLESRVLLSNYAAANVPALIADINAANAAGGANTIKLTAPTISPYVLTAVDNTTAGATGLPVIAANDKLTIVGNGDSIQRSTAAGTADFRLFDVAAGATLTLKNLTLQGGLSLGTGVSAEGGAIYNQGTLALSGVIVENNIAQGAASQYADGGGIYSSGTLTLTAGTTIENNEALGGVGVPGTHAGLVHPGSGGNAFGGGIYLMPGATAHLTDVDLASNTAEGGNGRNYTSTAPDSNAAPGGNGSGGALYGVDVTVTLSSVTVSSNIAVGGQGGSSLVNYEHAPGAKGGDASGGGLDVSGTVSLVGNTLSFNNAQGGNGGAGFSLVPVAGGNDPGGNDDGGNGFGGALFIGGTDTLTGDILSTNTAQGGVGGTETYYGGIGGVGFGGGLYFGAGTPLTVTGSTFSSNTAQGGGNGFGAYTSAAAIGNGFGGAIYIGSSTLFGSAIYSAGSTVTFNSDSLSSNVAQGGPGGLGEGGGVCIYAGGPVDIGTITVIYAGATVDIGTSTVADIINNTASTSSPNIFGTYTKTK